MEHRINWTPLFINNYNPQMTKQMTNYNFKWKYGPKNVEYKKLAKSNDNLDKQKCVNHFEFHTEISDKRKMFINLLKFCDLIDFDIFTIFPMTIILNFKKDNYDKNFKSFSLIFNILNEKKENKLSSNSMKITNSTNKDITINKNYTDLFVLNDKVITSKTYITIPYSFFTNHNLWIIKPVDLCQGSCMKISNNLQKLNKKAKKYFSGIDKTFKDSDDESKRANEEKIHSDGEAIIENSTDPKKKKKKEKSIFNLIYFAPEILRKPSIIYEQKI